MAASAALACGVLLWGTAACAPTTEPPGPGGAPASRLPAAGSPRPASPASPATDLRPEGIGERMWQQVPAATRQLVVVYGDDRDSPDGLVALYEKQGTAWERTGGWPAHNGRKGWTTDHHMDDERTPVGVFTLTDAGGARRDPGSRLRYWYDDHAYASMTIQTEAHAHDFDYVIAVDYNRRTGVPPFDWTRPEGVERGGGIWLHLDHGDGTSACVTLPEPGMRTLLRTLDPESRPVVVMGDRERLGI
ncbi:L,D-transpeptidase family protein [Streptomyces adustus]|uniref:L,D-transpeptidase family protein n=1 Tax=Streptomyces adustus TaxID=1609272 RepID=A0A5N8V712_9ACTN|nr:L,D-transpeptidase family protein [Streptomyces adustus]MPY30983.1 L,D-transpeptidase family protein [Streptomyces adustus]